MKRRTATTGTKANGTGPSVDEDEQHDKRWKRRRPNTGTIVKVGAAATVAAGLVVTIASHHDNFASSGEYLRSLSKTGSCGGKDDGIFIAIKSTHSNQHRISSILDTYWSFAPGNTAFFTDSPAAKDASTADKTLPDWPTRSMSDPLLSNPTKDAFNLIDTKCGVGHNLEGLCCKTAAEIRYFHDHSTADWFCGIDDDTFLVYPNLQEYLKGFDPLKDHFIGYSSTKFPVEKDRKKKLEEGRKKGGAKGPNIRVMVQKAAGDQPKDDEETTYVAYATGGAGWCLSRPLVERGIDKLTNLAQTCSDIVYSDDVTLGYVVQVQLGVEMKKERRLHSHLDEQTFVSKEEAMEQLTFGSGYRTVTTPIIPKKPINKIDQNDNRKILQNMFGGQRTKVFTFASYPGASFVNEATKMPPDHDPLAFRALYCDFWPDRCKSSR